MSTAAARATAGAAAARLRGCRAAGLQERRLRCREGAGAGSAA